ncbi:MAG: 2-C-methyl-D-erythritol 4-phosphate cytidylyltransferase [Gemmatimonadales bacterium]|nr:2-C-methyl-D-erythritol 4-phosphate cytidylyltransferase [Gemmatimonadales bacterium]
MLAAAGRGERLRTPENKAFVALAGRPLVSYALDAFQACPGVGDIVLVVAPEDVERARRQLLPPGRRQSQRVVAGGENRQQSVAAALAEIGPACDLIVVHDGARPFVKPDLIQRCIDAAAEHGAAVAALPATETVKEAGADRVVEATLDRSRVWLVQTPQAFRRELLARAHEEAAQAGICGTDDAYLVERLDHKVHLVLGDPENIKITWPADVRRSEQLMQRNREGTGGRDTTRAGIGYDAHRFAEDRPLVLAGVRLREERGLLGHSDADVVCHAVCDALLGAIGAGDIGRHFPDSDPEYAGVSSLSLLRRVSGLVRTQGWEIGNVDAVVIAEEPRIAPHLAEMRRALAEAMGTDAARVNLKGKTTEGLGFTGRSEGIASQAVAVLRPRDNSRAGASSEE